jgi:hypothetical protein
MKSVRLLAFALLLPALPAAAADDDPALGHMLALVQSIVRIAAHAESPQESLRAFDEVLAGRNAEVNRAVMGLFDEMTADMSPRNRERVASIGRDLASLGRSNKLQASEQLQARKDLNAMGLRYYDEQQFLDAARRGDKLAVELFIAGGGIDLRELADKLARSPRAER